MKSKLSMRNTSNLAFVVLTFMVLGCVCGGNKQQPPNNSPSNSSNTISIYASPTPTPPSAKSPKDNFEYGLRDYNNGYFKTAKEYLSAIPEGSPEYKRAQEMLAKINKKEDAENRSIDIERKKILEKQRRAEKEKVDEAKKSGQKLLDSVTGKKNPKGHY